MNPVLDIEIVHLAPGIYEVHCDGQQKSTMHDSIAAAIRCYGNEVPQSYAQYANLNYAGVGLGTRYIPHFVRDAELLATELVELAADVHRSVQEMERMRSHSAQPSD